VDEVKEIIMAGFLGHGWQPSLRNGCAH